MAENILDLMIIQHSLLESSFSVFQSEVKSGAESVKVSFAEFTAETKTHFFVEEDIIFSFMSWKEPVIGEIINQLKREHSVMLDMLDKMSQNLQAISTEDLESFYSLLENHRKVEEKNLYPRLDNSLSELQKKEIVAKINQVKK
jgi:hemerythrin-like domain-containing protein